MFVHAFLLPLIWSAVLLLALVIHPFLAGLGAPQPVAGLAAATMPPVSGQPSDPRSTARASSLGYAAAMGGQGSAARTPDAYATAIADEVFRLTNLERQKAKAGLPALARDTELAVAARAHSLDMLDRGFFDHVTPENLTPSDRVAGIHRTLIGGVGENLYKDAVRPAPANPAAGVDAAKLAERAVNWLMKSPEHKGNILRWDYTHLGIGVAHRNGDVLVTQVFADAEAFLMVPLPASVKRHANVDLRIAQGAQAQQFALFRPDRGVRAYGPVDVARPEIDAATGLYRLEVVFVAPEGRSIYFGPDIDVMP